MFLYKMFIKCTCGSIPSFRINKYDMYYIHCGNCGKNSDIFPNDFDVVKIEGVYYLKCLINAIADWNEKIKHRKGEKNDGV